MGGDFPPLDTKSDALCASKGLGEDFFVIERVEMNGVKSVAVQEIHLFGEQVGGKLGEGFRGRIEGGVTAGECGGNGGRKSGDAVPGLSAVDGKDSGNDGT